MKVIEFVKEFNEVEDKESFVKEHILNTYIPYLNKKERCSTLVKITTEKNLGKIGENEQKVYFNSSANRHLLYMLELIRNYTDLEVDMTSATDYDALTECKAIYLIHELMPKAELAEWQMILDMELNDAYDNYRTMPSWLDTKFDAMKLVFHSISSAFEEALKDVNIADVLSNPEIIEAIKKGVGDQSDS